MNMSSKEPPSESHNDQCPLLLEPRDSGVDEEHIIDVERGGEASSSGSSTCQFSRVSTSSQDGRSISGIHIPLDEPSSASFNRSRSSSFFRRSEGIGHRNWSTFNSGLWISIESIFTLSQIIASLTILCLSRHERPRAPLFAWLVGYTAGCFASLPVLYWRFLNRYRSTERDGVQSIQATESGAVQSTQASHEHSMASQNSNVTISLTPPTEQEDHHSVTRPLYEGQMTGISNTRIGLIMDHFKMTLDCFFAIWFVVGNVWIFGGHASAAEAPNLYRLCIVYLTLSCIGYAMPFILCAMICCCLPCIISVLGIREELSQGRGASEEAISSLLTYRFKVKKGDGGFIGKLNFEEGGIIAVGTAKERHISREDAICCICLARYVNNVELRELPCTHFFHTDCVDTWLKINATCPLCKFEIVEEHEQEQETLSH